MTHPSEASLLASRAAGVTVFVSDPTAEAERISAALRSAGFQVIDVALSMLVARVAVQRPQVVIVDADTEGAIDAIGRMREVHDCESVDVLFTGRAGSLPSLDGAAADSSDLSGIADALAFEGSGFFSRPVDPAAVVRKVRALAFGAPSSRLSGSSHPPASMPPSSELGALAAPLFPTAPVAVPGLPAAPPAAAPSRRSLPPNAASLRPEFSLKSLSVSPPPLSITRGGTLSRELELLLAEAEGRVADQGPSAESLVPTPEEELEAVLPAGVLDALDAPLDDKDDDGPFAAEVAAPRVTTSGGRNETTGARGPALSRESAESVAKTGAGRAATYAAPTNALTDEPTNAGRGSASTEARRVSRETSAPEPGGRVTAASFSRRGLSSSQEAVSAPDAPRSSRSRSSVPPPTAFAPPPETEDLAASVRRHAGDAAAPYVSSEAPAKYSRTAHLHESEPPPAVAPPRAVLLPAALPPAALPPVVPAFAQSYAVATSVVGAGTALRMLADAVSQRTTATLTVDSDVGIRRVVLHEGDLVTAASSVESESLLAFLGGRGDLPRERVAQLEGRLPPHGRHAGAALVAQGALSQDQLWPVLRSHAEWLVGVVLALERGAISLEPEAPGRLRNEPSVFGGATGAEVFVDVVRRTLDVAGAMLALGGRSSRVAEGRNAALLSECALGDVERDFVARAPGATVGELATAHPDLDVAPLLHALALLGGVEIVRSLASRSPSLPPNAGASQLDVDAVRERVRARRELVDLGDYFSVLGVPRQATSYEIRRAFSALRREFDPARMLTPAVVDLADDLRKIVGVLEEAYEVLGDGSRRERYRRAIEDVPPR